MNGVRDTHVESFWWVSPERLFMTFSTEFENDAQRWMLPALYAVDADGHNRAETYAYVIDSLPHDDDQVLIADCHTAHINEDDCVPEVRRADADDFRRRGKPVVGPMAGASFLTDHDGEVRFAWAVDKDDVQKLYFRNPKDKDWTRERVLRALTDRDAIGEVPARPDDPYIGAIGSGRETAPLVGGCLWLLRETLATPWEVDFDGSILFFEDVHCPPWHVDGLLTHLTNAGKLEGIVGIAIGEFAESEPWREAKPWLRGKSLVQRIAFGQ